ncbi:MAG TPA: hypothetical protein VEB18_00310 [Candidatus Paceibacterota bacterium]|nr:hypothetical protein [Candidatus Paceibacterota bacterium]
MKINNLPIRDLVVTGALALLALAAVFSAGLVVTDTPSNTELSRMARQQEINTLRSRTILAHSVQAQGGEQVVLYTYLGEPLPEKLAEDEVTALRKPTSWTKQAGTAADGRAIYESIVYTQPQFVQHGNAWHYLEYGTASVEAFEEAGRLPLFSRLFANIAHAVSQTQYVSPGDGSIFAYDATTWANVQGTSTPSGATFGGFTTYTTTSMQVGSEHYVNTGKFDFKAGGYYIYRSFLPFDTSFLPYGANISAASLNVYATSTATSTDNDGVDYITVVQSTQADEYSLVDADYGRAGNTADNPTEGIDAGQRKDLSSVSIGSYLTFTLNSTGRGWIKKNGEASACGTAQYIILDSTTTTTWQVPYDWDASNNSIEVIGGGGSGKSGCVSAANCGGGGGGGGGYSKVTNVSLPPGQTVTISVGVRGTGDGTSGGDTYLCNSTSNCSSISDSAVVVGAKGGAGGTDPGSGTALGGGGAGGAAASGVGTVKYSGGNGGNRNAGAGGGGGGSGGPNGDGAVGGAGGTVSPRGGGGGGGANGGSAGSQGTSASTGGAGGNNHLGAGGGSAGVGSTLAGTGSQGGGGGGGGGHTSSALSAGGTTAYSLWGSLGPAGGSGGGGHSTGSNLIHGGSGAVSGYGGGSGGGGGTNNGATQGGLGQVGGSGVIVVQYANSSKGTTCFALREGHDTTDNTIANNSRGYVHFSTSEVSGTSQDPYLSVTYTAPFAFWQFFDF